ncbi:unnamed protein product, partial [Prorocentrum cordatum]
AGRLQAGGLGRERPGAARGVRRAPGPAAPRPAAAMDSDDEDPSCGQPSRASRRARRRRDQSRPLPRRRRRRATPRPRRRQGQPRRPRRRAVQRRPWPRTRRPSWPRWASRSPRTRSPPPRRSPPRRRPSPRRRGRPPTASAQAATEAAPLAAEVRTGLTCRFKLGNPFLPAAQLVSWSMLKEKAKTNFTVPLAGLIDARTGRLPAGSMLEARCLRVDAPAWRYELSHSWPDGVSVFIGDTRVFKKDPQAEFDEAPGPLDLSPWLFRDPRVEAGRR